MTRREAAIVSLYTGFALSNFSDMHKYAEELLGRPIFTYEFANPLVCKKLAELAKQDFINIAIE